MLYFLILKKEKKMKKNIGLILTVALLSSGASLHANSIQEMADLYNRDYLADKKQKPAKKQTIAQQFKNILWNWQNAHYWMNTKNISLYRLQVLKFITTNKSLSGDVADKYGETTLMAACRFNDSDMVNFVLDKAHANFKKGVLSSINAQIQAHNFPLIKNNQKIITGWTALDLANYHNPTIALLEEHGAKTHLEVAKKPAKKTKPKSKAKPSAKIISVRSHTLKIGHPITVAKGAVSIELSNKNAQVITLSKGRLGIKGIKPGQGIAKIHFKDGKTIQKMPFKVIK
jgi:hypothetical protein